MTYNTEDFVRRAAGGILRSDKYRGRVRLLTVPRHDDAGTPASRLAPVRDRTGDGQGVQDSGRDQPTCRHSICALCQKTMPCIGAPRR